MFVDEVEGAGAEIGEDVGVWEGGLQEDLVVFKLLSYPWYAVVWWEGIAIRCLYDQLFQLSHHGDDNGQLGYAVERSWVTRIV